MVKKTLKSRSIKSYLNEYKKDNLYCQHCHKQLERTSLVYKKQALTKYAISEMREKINEEGWLLMKSELIMLCRFCRDIYCMPECYFFDLKGFKQYLIKANKMTKMTIHEYVIRLKRLDTIFSKAQFKVKSNLLEDFKSQFESEMTKEMFINYSVAISVYLRYKN